MISVIIPTYKRNGSLPRAIESVLQNHGDFEVIVVDDNDECSEFRRRNIEMLKKYESHSNFKYLQHKKNKNGAAARNTGIREAHGEYVTFLDDDDEFYSNRIEEIEKIVRQKKSDLIISGYEVKKKGILVNRNIPELDKCSIKDLQILLLKQDSFFGTGSNIVCRREIINQINGFDESFRRHQDMEFMIRFLSKCKNLFVIPQYLVIKNIDDIQNLPNVSDLFEIKKDFLQKFNYLIEAQNNDIKKAIYYANLRELLYFSYLFNDKKKTTEIKVMLRKMGIYKYFDDISICIKTYIKNFIESKR
ncbi:MAG: glycosyltransferase family 2 protein [Clostridiaceae bacterium]|nr:glycosyltransferase family 2 protein [Clostridiaceae bacterium]